jgi:hypothetical protein
MNSFVINADLLIILEINKKRTIEVFKNNASPRPLKEGRERLARSQASYS